MKKSRFLYKLFKAIWDIHVAVITKDTGVSSKSYVMVLGFWIAWEVTQVMLVLTVLDYIETRILNYTGISILLGALSAFVLASAYGKTKVEQSYYESMSEENASGPNTQIP